MSSTTASSGLYVPPARRSAPNSAGPSSSSASASAPGPSRTHQPPSSSYRPPGQRRPDDPPSFSQSSSQTYRAPWAHSAPAAVGQGKGRPPSPPRPWGRERERDRGPYANDWDEGGRGPQAGLGGRNGWARDARTYNSAPTGSNSKPVSTSPTLYVFGDSFTGPLKLLTKDCCRVQPYKGASAKGLNNPHSLKQVAKELLPAVNSWLAPPPYVYTPATGRYALFIFGNVDLQINFLWQLQNKRISVASFPPGTKLPNLPESSELVDTAGSDKETSVLASATETTLSGPALGPELFVDGIIKAYTSFLEREIVNGPIGQRVRDRASGPRRSEAVHKVLIAAALPPLVVDETLPRIPEKYVERLEEDHQKQHQEMERSRSKDRRPPRLNLLPRPAVAIDPVEDGLSTLQLSDDPPSTSSIASAGSAASSRAPSNTPPSSPPSSAASDRLIAPTATHPSKTSIEELLTYDPPLCTLPVRIEMTNRYNLLLRAFCARHPEVLGFVDIAPLMLEADALAPPEEKEPAGTLPPGAVSRRTWACPVDESNIHPLWEPTLPLWLRALKEQGVLTDGFGIGQDAEASFAAYELDKKRRVGAREQDWGARKLRDEE